jgi:hypothetical protein
MMSLIRRRPSVGVVEREDPSLSLAAWAELLNAFSYSGISYTLPGSTQEEIGAQFVSAARSAYKQNGVVFACCLVRMLLFAEAQDDVPPHPRRTPRRPVQLQGRRPRHPAGSVAERHHRRPAFEDDPALRPRRERVRRAAAATSLRCSGRTG